MKKIVKIIIWIYVLSTASSGLWAMSTRFPTLYRSFVNASRSSYPSLSARRALSTQPAVPLDAAIRAVVIALQFGKLGIPLNNQRYLGLNLATVGSLGQYLSETGHALPTEYDIANLLGDLRQKKLSEDRVPYIASGALESLINKNVGTDSTINEYMDSIRHGR